MAILTDARRTSPLTSWSTRAVSSTRSSHGSRGPTALGTLSVIEQPPRFEEGEYDE